MKFETNTFSGCIPKNPSHLIQMPYSEYCLDCNLEDGQLKPFRDLSPVLEQKIEEYNKLVRMKCCWVKLPLCASFAEDSNCNVFYVTGRNTYPEEIHINKDTCNFIAYRLGLPCPDSIIQASEPDTCDELDRDSVARTYVYQYVNSRGQRSQASPPSNSILVNDCTPVVLSGWTKPHESWDVVSIRIYRSVIFTNSTTSGAISDSDYMFVAEIPIDDSSYVDRKCDVELEDILYEGTVKPPPCDLQGIISITNTNTFAGYCKNKIYFSRNNMPWNWDIELVLDDNVKGIAESNGYLYVGTEGRPYVIQSAVDCNTAECRQVLKFEDPFPMLGYGNNSIIATPYGAFYPSIEGLIGLKANSNPIVYSSSIYSHEQWANFLPHDLVLSYNNGILFIFGKKISSAINLGSSSKNDFFNHTYLSDTDIIYAFNGDDGYLYVEKNDGVFIFNKGIDYRTFLWRSPVLQLSSYINFSAAQAMFERNSLHIKIAGDDRIILDRELMMSNRPFRLPMWSSSTSYQFELQGKCIVKKVSLSTSVKEL